MPAFEDPSGTLNVRSSKLRRFIRYNRHLSSYRINSIPEWRWIIFIIFLTVQNFDGQNYSQHGNFFFSLNWNLFRVLTIILIYQYCKWENPLNEHKIERTQKRTPWNLTICWGNSVFSVWFSTTEMRITNLFHFLFVLASRSEMEG